MNDKDKRIYEYLLTLYDECVIDVSDLQRYIKLLFGENFFETEDFFSSYEKYLASPEWAKKRAEIKDLYDNKCYICGAEERLEVHHTTYQNLGHETEYDTVCLCHDCHMKMHELKEWTKDIKPDSPCLTDKEIYPRAHAWHEEMKERLYEMKKFIDSTFKKIKHAECMISGAPVDILTSRYVKLFGDKTIKQHLPKIGSIVGDTCGFQSIAPCITSGIRNKLKMSNNVQADGLQNKTT